MKTSKTIENPDVILIGSGIMSATLGTMLKELDPALKIQLYEMTESFAQEASNGWHNAGTGHAGICELSYTPDYGPDGKVKVAKAIEIFQQFEHSKQFGATPRARASSKWPRCINPVPHPALSTGAQVDFLKSRFEGMQAHHFFKDMEYTEDREQIKEWAPCCSPTAMTRRLPQPRWRPAPTSTTASWPASRSVVGRLTDAGYATSHRITNSQSRRSLGSGGRQPQDKNTLQKLRKIRLHRCGWRQLTLCKSPASPRAKALAASQLAANG